ncbi:MAG: hypothetical protein E6Q76_07320 [Rhizobium sp.]|nr:MAG: hypothetical protein E6Q76_07320 [Rhizobium sp.]
MNLRLDTDVLLSSMTAALTSAAFHPTAYHLIRATQIGFTLGVVVSLAGHFLPATWSTRINRGYAGLLVAAVLAAHATATALYG